MTSVETSDPQTAQPAFASALLRHFADLRDGTHGHASSREDKERLFASAVPLLDPYARQALDEINTYLSWPEQLDARISPIVIRAHYGSRFHHPHLQSGTVGDWPFNVYNEEQAAMELPTLRAMAAVDLHNLVFQLGGDVRVIPATVTGKDS
jgi:hypothetical protein